MASPQLENGYTRIANEILERLCCWHLSSYEWRCLLFILRKTYGFSKKEDWICLNQFVEATDIQQSHVCRALKLLLIQNIITKGGTKRQPLYSFQKDHKKWEKLLKGLRSHHKHITKGGTRSLPKGAYAKGGNDGVPKGVIGGVPKGAHTKENVTKETLQKKIASEKSDAVDHVKSPKKQKADLMNMQEFDAYMNESKRKALHIIGSWAKTIKPNFTTYGEWMVFMRRHLRAATELEAFSEDQMARAYGEIMDDSKDGEKFKPTLETLIKYLTK